MPISHRSRSISRRRASSIQPSCGGWMFRPLRRSLRRVSYSVNSGRSPPAITSLRTDGRCRRSPCTPGSRTCCSLRVNATLAQRRVSSRRSSMSAMYCAETRSCGTWICARAWRFLRTAIARQGRTSTATRYVEYGNRAECGATSFVLLPRSASTRARPVSCLPSPILSAFLSDAKARAIAISCGTAQVRCSMILVCSRTLPIWSSRISMADHRMHTSISPHRSTARRWTRRSQGTSSARTSSRGTLRQAL